LPLLWQASGSRYTAAAAEQRSGGTFATIAPSEFISAELLRASSKAASIS